MATAEVGSAEVTGVQGGHVAVLPEPEQTDAMMLPSSSVPYVSAACAGSARRRTTASDGCGQGEREAACQP